MCNTWEQRKLGEVLKERTERAKGDEELLSVTIANGVIRQIDSEKRNTASEDRSNYKIVKKGDVPYNSMRMWQGAVGNSKYNGIVSPAYTILTPTSEANGKFFMELFKKKSTLQIFQRWSQGLTSDTWNLKYPILSSIQFAIPSVEEQEKIAEYFSSLDYLITLHQRKYFIIYNKLITWEQRKLGEVFEQTTNLVSPNEDEIELWSLTVEDGLTPKSERYNREFLVKKDNNFKEVRPGDIVYNPMNMTLGAVGYNGMAKSVAVSGYYTTMITKKGYDAYYINTWLKSPQAILLYKTYATGSLIEKQRVQFPTLSIIPAAFPNYDEQTKIGQYFESLDNLITLHRRAL
ncbi:restriction endonuclease subunit S [Eubacterium ventriosum]|uniref:restriction endonuclease subunit S n=1 Tax=Eubacterium ventriosum TaxID=39496 RepID=UPI0025B617D8